jgi:hypothetical protein
MVFAIGVKFRRSNFGIKGRIVHLVFPLSFYYCYVVEIYTDFLLVKMKRSINKEILENMKRKESLKSKSDGC